MEGQERAKVEVVGMRRCLFLMEGVRSTRSSCYRCRFNQGSVASDAQDGSCVPSSLALVSLSMLGPVVGCQCGRLTLDT